MTGPKIRILFLCVHNSARSQLAEGLMRKLAGNRVEVYSAGSEPSVVNPFALRVLQDEGIDPGSHYAKSVQVFIHQPFDYVITLCEEQVCPAFPGAVTHLHWPIPDPANVDGDSEEKLNAFRQTAQVLTHKIQEFLQQLLLAYSHVDVDAPSHKGSYSCTPVRPDG